MRNSERCSECGVMHETCPDCGSHNVTPLEPPSSLPPTESVEEFVQSVDETAEATFTNLCWDCGWEEQRTVSVSVES